MTMRNSNLNSVPNTLTSVGATLIRQGGIGGGLALAEWTNGDRYAEYERPGHHTLSLYLDGGQKVYRHGRRNMITGGGPGKICLLPADHESRWDILSDLQMFHLYIDKAAVSKLAVQTFDMDPRRIEMQDLTFGDDALIDSVVRSAILPHDWTDAGNRLMLDSAARLLLVNLVKNHVSSKALEVRGGLAPAVRHRLADYIEANLEQPLTLEDLAMQAGLSPYHLAKMFKVSFGVPPHRYVNGRRIEKARHLLAGTGNTLADIALACGYSSQSHFSNAFKTAVGITPGRYRRDI